MDLEIVGRHALFFDDDSMATFVNSPTALVDWNSLFIDRYDVRHLLSSPPPPRSKRRRPISDDPDLEPKLDHERYFYLPAESPSLSHDVNDINDVSANTNVDGFRAVPFSYGSTSDFNDQKDAYMESGFHPPFPVPDYLLQNLMLGEEMELSKLAIHRHLVSFYCHDKGQCRFISLKPGIMRYHITNCFSWSFFSRFFQPPTEKLHQIMARTSSFVSKHGGQSEIVLRVKQGSNPTFGFLMPDHHLHPYFRFLVDHQDLLMGKSSVEDKKIEGGKDGGALSLLGSVYGTVEDEDIIEESAKDSKTNESAEGDDGVKEGLKKAAKIATERDAASKHSLTSNDKAYLIIKSNPSVSAVNVVERKQINTEDNSTEKLLTSDKLQSSAMPAQPKRELQIVEPPIEMKKVIDKIVDFIQKNGKELEATLAAQDVKYGMFPFLRPASLYHAYYRKVLQEAEELKSCDKSDITKKEDMKQEKMGNSVKDDKPGIGSVLPDDTANKEKVKMVSDKPKTKLHSEVFKPVEPQMRVTVDANTAAAILQAARRGIRNPQLGILSGKPLDTSSQILGNDGSNTSSKCPDLAKSTGQLISGSAAASEADSSEAGLSKEQKLKAERLKRAKMFVAMLKPGAQPVQQAERSRSLSVEPSDSGISGFGANATKERESSSIPFEAEMKQAEDGNSERRSKRNYRPRSQRDDIDEMEEEEEEESSMEEAVEGTKTEKKHSSRKRHDRHKHKTRHSAKDRHSRGKHRRESSSDDEYHSRRHKRSKSSDRHVLYDSSDNEREHRHRSSKHNKDDDYSKDKSRHHDRSRRHDKHLDSSDDEHHRHHHRHRSSRRKHEDSSDVDKSSKRVKKEEEETVLKSGAEPTQVSDELRAKIRAMLADAL